MAMDITVTISRFGQDGWVIAHSKTLPGLKLCAPTFSEMESRIPSAVRLAVPGANVTIQQDPIRAALMNAMAAVG